MAKRETKLTFEEKIAQLEHIVGQLEAGKLPLAESFDAYERGASLLKELGEELTAHELKIVLLTQDGEQPLDIEDEAE